MNDKRDRFLLSVSLRRSSILSSIFTFYLEEKQFPPICSTCVIYAGLLSRQRTYSLTPEVAMVVWKASIRNLRSSMRKISLRVDVRWKRMSPCFSTNDKLDMMALFSSNRAQLQSHLNATDVALPVNDIHQDISKTEGLFPRKTCSPRVFICKPVQFFAS